MAGSESGQAVSVDTPARGRRIPVTVPWLVRKQLYNWHPSRARRWAALPGLQTLRGPHAALTFDDGPGPDATPAVLDELARLGVPATFFVLGVEVLKAPDLARRIVADGHELGCHGFAHPRFDLLSAEEAREDLERGMDAIESATGVRPRWFRPPYGKLSELTYGVCTAMQLEVAYWSVWGLDWEAIGSRAIAREVKAGLRSGSIVLLHDNGAYGRRPDAKPTVDALGAIVARGAELGLRWSTLSEVPDAGL
jgi:peptidoglycan/xylan/chitin deacetylase (PgdA/CDA1 family)